MHVIVSKLPLPRPPLQFLSEPTFRAEHELFLRFLHAGVYVLAGKQSYCPYPGWFRIIFASSQHMVMEGECHVQGFQSLVS